MEKLCSNSWDFTLYKVDGEKIISVVFHNSFVDTSKSFKLNNEEEEFDFERLKELSEHIRNNYDLYKDREVIPSL